MAFLSNSPYTQRAAIRSGSMILCVPLLLSWLTDDAHSSPSRRLSKALLVFAPPSLPSKEFHEIDDHDDDGAMMMTITEATAMTRQTFTIFHRRSKTTAESSYYLLLHWVGKELKRKQPREEREEKKPVRWNFMNSSCPNIQALLHQHHLHPSINADDIVAG